MPKKKLKKIFFLIKLSVITFISFFLTICLFFSCLVITLSFRDIEIKQPNHINKIKTFLNFKISGYNVDFSYIKFNKTPLKELKLSLYIKDIKIIHSKSKIKVVDLPEIQTEIPLQKLTKGKIVPYISNINDTTINIPYQGKRQNKNINNKNDNKKKKNLLDYIKIFSSTFYNILNDNDNALKNGLKLTNLSINFIDTKTKIDVFNFDIKNSEIKIIDKSKNIFSTQQVELIEKLLKIKQQYAEQNTLSSLFNYLDNLYQEDKFVYSEIEMEKDKQIFKIKGVCDNNKSEERKCLFNIIKFPIKILDVNNYITQIVNLEEKMDGYIYIDVDDYGILNTELEINIKQDKNARISFNHFNKKIDNIKLKLLAKDNIEKIKKAEMIIMDGKHKIVEVIGKDISYDKDVLFNGGYIDVKVNNIMLSDFYNFLSNKVSLKTIKSIDGIIDGQMKFKIMKDGSIKAINEKYANISIKKLILNSKQYEYDLSNLLLSVEPVGNKFLFKIQNKDNQDKENIKEYITLTYDSKNNELLLSFDDLKISEEYFTKIKQTFLTERQLELTKTFTYSTTINGNIRIPIKTRFSKNGYIDLKIDVLAKDYNDTRDDDVFIQINKQKNTNKGKILIDFGKSRMRSELYDLDKKEEDKMIITTDFDLLPKEKKFEIKFDGKWFFNDKQISKFNFYSGKKQMDVKIKSKNANLIVNSKDMKNFYAKIFGDRVGIDYDLWHAIIFYTTLSNSNSVLDLNIEKIPNVKIDKLTFNNLDFHCKLFGNFFLIGNIDCDNYTYKNKKQGGIHLFLKDGISKINVNNVIPLFELIDVSENEFPMKIASIEGNGVHFIEDKQIHFDNVKISFDKYRDNGVFNYTIFTTATTNDLNVFENNIFAKNLKVNGYNINGIFDFEMDIDFKTKLEGMFMVNSSLRVFKNIKNIFVNDDKLTTKSGGVKLLKKGDNFTDFIRHMEINGKDFSTDINGKQKKKLNLISEVLTK